MFYSLDGYSTFANHLVRLVDGASVEDHKVGGIATVGNPYVWPGDGFVHLAVTAMRDFGGYSVQAQGYWRLSPEGQIQESAWVANSSNYSGAPSPVAQGGTDVGMVYWPPTGAAVYATRASDGTWSTAGSVSGSNDYGLQLGLRKDGTAFVGTTTGSFGGPIYVDEVGSETHTVDPGTCQAPALRVAPDDTVWVVYESGAVASSDGTVKAWTLKGSSTPKTEDVGSGSVPNIAFDADGKPVIAYVSGGKSVVVATRPGGAWTSKTVYTATGDEILDGYVAIGVDSAGRRHIAFSSSTPAEGNNWNATMHLSYVMSCP